jgi:hypothetical protein
MMHETIYPKQTLYTKFIIIKPPKSGPAVNPKLTASRTNVRYGFRACTLPRDTNAGRNISAIVITSQCTIPKCAYVLNREEQ